MVRLTPGDPLATSMLRSLLDTPHLAWFRRTPLWMRTLLVLAPFYIAWLATYPKRTPSTRVVELGYILIFQVITAWFLWRAGKREDSPTQFRSGLRWMASSFLVLFIATALLPIAGVIQKSTFPIGLVDLFYIGAYPLAFIGQAKLPRAGQPVPGMSRIMLDSAVFVVGVGAPLWVFAIHPATAETTLLRVLLGTLYPIMAFLGVMALNLVLLRCIPFPNRAAFNLLLTGLGVSWFSDILFSIQVTGGGGWAGLNYWGNIINFTSLTLCLLAAWRLASDPAPVAPLRPAAFSPIPMIAIVLISLWLIRLLGSGMDVATLQRVLIGVILLFLVLLLRETLAAKDSLRLATEAATIELRARFETLVRHSSDLLLVLDHRSDITFASPAASRVMGLDPESMRGRKLTEFLHPEDVRSTTTFVKELLHHPDTLIHQCRLRHADGTWRTLEISGSNLLEDPTVQGFVLNARDISERRRLEDQLREAQKMEAVGRLAGGVAHDFNNLLSAILGNAELAEAHLTEGHPAALDLKRIYGAATRGAVLTSRLLSFCRRDLPESKIIDPAELVKGVTPLLEGLLGERIRLVLDLDRGVWPVRIDPNELEQALLNMAANARDAMPDGGRLTLTLQNLTVPEALVTPYLPIATGEAVALDVTDSGTGMDEATLQHLFEPFFTTKARGKGTGLGLASVYGLVKASQGGIDVQSSPGCGTTIRLVFPRASAAPDEDDTVSGPQPIHGCETVLLVEDEPSVRESTQRSLTANGYVVLAAGDADEARAIFRNRSADIHLLLTDVIMPGDSGPALAAELVKSHPGLRVLYMSGYTANELGPHGLARPEAPLLRKPFTMGQLTRRLRAVLAGPPGRI
jgi:PAS domain S-box-containing protein